MDWEIFGFSIFVIIYLVATISEKTKKRKEKKLKKQTVLPAQAFEGDSERDDLTKEQPIEEAAFDDPCDEEEKPRIHLHQVSEQELEAAQEGEDPCHAGGEGTALSERDPMDDAPEPEEIRQDSDVLRGIIMSEILMRPAERSALRRIRRGKRT